MKEKNIAPEKENFFGNNGDYLLKRKKFPVFEKTTFWFILVILAVFPLFIGPQSYNNITVTKFIGFASVTFIYAAIIALIAAEVYLFDKKTGKARLEEIPSSFRLPQFMACGIFLLGLVSMLVSKQTDMWIGQSRYEGLCSVLLYTLVFIGVSCWGEFSDKYIYAFGACMTIVCIISLIQISGRDFLLVTNYFSNQFLAMTGNIDVVSGLVSIAVPLLAGAFIMLEGKARYFFCLPQIAMLMFIQLFIDVDSGKIGLLASFVLLAILACTDFLKISRFFIVAAVMCVSGAIYKVLSITGAAGEVSTVTFVKSNLAIVLLIAAAVFGALSFALTKIKKPFPLSPKKTRLIILAFFIVIVVIALVYLYNYDGEIQLLTEINGVLHGELSDRAGNGRGFIWKNTVKLIGENPLLGTGPGTYVSAFDEYSKVFQETFNSTVYFDFAHNDYLQIAEERGLLSLGLYLAFLVIIAIRALKVIDRNPLVIIFAVAALGYLGHAFFAFSIAILTPLFWVVLGLLDKCTKQTPPEAEKAK